MWKSEGVLDLDNKWPNSTGTGYPFRDGESYNVRLGVGTNSNGTTVEVLGANVYDDNGPNGDWRDGGAEYTNGLFSRKRGEDTGVTGEGNYRITRHFKKIYWNGNKWVEVANPDAPWL